MEAMECRSCENHQDIKEQLKLLTDISSNSVAWQASFEGKMDRLISEMKASRECQAELKKDLHSVMVDLAGSYVTKGDFEIHRAASEDRIKRVHGRLDEILAEQKQSLWKVITLLVPVMGLVFGLVQWIFSHI